MHPVIHNNKTEDLECMQTCMVTGCKDRGKWLKVGMHEAPTYNGVLGTEPNRESEAKPTEAE